MTSFFVKKLNKSLKPFSSACLFFQKKNSEIIVGRHNLFFQGQKKAASYGRLGKLWQAAASYDSPTMISEN